MNPDSLLADLTDEQRQAVTHVDGPLLIIAGAGSGKTRVITRRVAWLLGLGIPGPSILAITFTNKAAGEMKTRVSAMLDRPLRDFGRLDQPWPILCTFHSLCLRILRHYAAQTGLSPNFSVYDTSDQERILKEALKLAEANPNNFTPAAVRNAISTAKNKLLSPEGYASAQGDFFGRTAARVYAHYQKLLAQNNAMDFDDLLMRTAFLFRDHPDILRELQQRFQYILIDEYQDTNHAQYVVAHALALAHRNLCVVGDPDQSIYAWRGADIQNILDFEKDYPQARVIKLERNYRSTQAILDIASALISRNQKRKDKRLWTDNAGGDPATVLFCENEHEEALAVARRFQELQGKGFQWSQMAVFYRINAFSRVMEDALRRCGIPYRIARGVDFYHRKEIKDVLAYLRVIANPADELSLERIVNTPPRGIGETSFANLRAHALSAGKPLFTLLEAIGEVPGVAARTANAVRQFVNLIHRWRARAAAPGAVRDLVDDVVKSSGLDAYLNKSASPDKEEAANVNELISSAAQFDEETPEGTLEDYLNQVSLVSDIDLLKEGGGAVTLMTLHAAKGLEFPVVSIIALEEGSLPHARVIEHPEQLEEERRLCFVGITRAQQQLILSRAARRTLRGQSLPTAASRFFAEMPRDLLDVVEVAPAGDAIPRGEADPLQRGLAARYRKGQLVRHPVFGVGRIADLSDMGAKTRAIVDFQKAGRKTLILEVARLDPLS